MELEITLILNRKKKNIRKAGKGYVSPGKRYKNREKKDQKLIKRNKNLENRIKKQEKDI